MGFGLGAFDLLKLGEQPDPEEERRKRQLEEMFTPADAEVGPQEPLMEEEVQPPDIIQAPRILGSDAHETSDILSQYKDWMARRPDPEKYKPSTGRKILGSLAGFLTGLAGGGGVGVSIADDIVHGKENAARRDWEEEGKTLGEVGKFAQQVSDTRRQREGDILGYEGTQKRIEATRQGIDQRREAENLRHTDRMSAITGDNERRGEIARHNKELEKIAVESNRIRGIEAAAATSQAKTGAENARLRGEELKTKQGAPRAKPAHYRAAVQDAIREMLPLYPDMADMFSKDKYGNWVPNADALSPVDAQRFQSFMADAKKRADKNLGLDPKNLPTAEPTDEVDEYSPLRENY